MAEGRESSNQQWGDWTAKITYVLTMIGTLLFVGSVFIFILL